MFLTNQNAEIVACILLAGIFARACLEGGGRSVCMVSHPHLERQLLKIGKACHYTAVLSS